MIGENVEKVISISNEDMNILHRATFLNKISSVKAIKKELKKNSVKIIQNLTNL